MFVRVNNSDTAVAAAARLEAMMIFKSRQLQLPDADLVFLQPRVVRSKEQTFNFGRIFEITIGELESGKRKMPREIEDMFS